MAIGMLRAGEQIVFEAADVLFLAPAAPARAPAVLGQRDAAARGYSSGHTGGAMTTKEG